MREQLYDDYDKLRDLSANRKLTLEDGSLLFIRRKDPFGFWVINYEKGVIPKEMQGSYTSFDVALKAVMNWANTRFNKKPVEIDKGFVVTKGDNKTVVK